MSARRVQFVGLVLVIAVFLAVTALLLRPSVMPPPGSGATPASAASLPASGWPRTFTGDLGEEITLAAPAARVVTLGPNLDEMLCAIGAADQLVGVSEYTTYPPEAAAKPKVGGLINPALERILALQPDVVLVMRGTDLQIIRRMRDLGLQVLTFDPQSVHEVVGTLEKLGTLCGRETRAAEVAAALRARLARVDEAVRARTAPPPRVLMVIAWDGLFVAGGSGFGDDLLKLAGCVNAVSLMPGANPQKPWLTVTREQVVAADPELLLLAGRDALPVGGDAPAALKWLRRDRGWSALSAVKRGQVFVVESDEVTIPGPRLVDGLEHLAAAVAQGESSLSR